ncbi:ATP-NAD kinase family protein [Microbacterium pseudoresistens]|uniref:Putative polyphosphate/ATP-dependent NAD kinase n=1 Tax=Microbacterium pseudoresistens TaxID=640634 RepID=A0A7Y9JN22_9MICO|nr:ATP-NAD kinase family protein [Microbacterium pseudoresistens]NYD54636.1 putative polyphosphate/ATP-dependent NAD kinase [Microbacterium pseudoresistens]
MTSACGLIVNPVAGVGGEVALAGSDGDRVQRLALSKGAVPRASLKAGRAVGAILARSPETVFLTGGGVLGEDVCRREGAGHRVLVPAPQSTSAEDTRRLAQALRDEGAELILFVGGDGTARDVCAVIGEDIPVLGVPAGVKMHSGVFAITPEHAGPLVATVFAGHRAVERAEVVDIDEDARRAGRLSARLYGHVLVPVAPEAVQRGKAGVSPGDPSSVDGIAAEVAGRWEPGVPCLLGPGTTVQRIAERLGLSSSLLGVDVVLDGVLTGSDLDATALHDAVGAGRFQVLVSPVGGQGMVLGRGNQQIDAALLSRLDPADLLIACPPRKLAQFAGRGLLIDAPSDALNRRFRGMRRVIVGHREDALLRVA